MELTAASESDIEYAKDCLRESGLPADVDREDLYLLVGRVNGRRVGVCGLEVQGSDALVRSVTVEPEARGEGHGTTMVEALLEDAAERGTENCYLLTTDAEGFFRVLGFERIAREEVPAAIGETREFAEVCPASATPLHRELD
jgi:amino-acid N-acetyltransferase